MKVAVLYYSRGHNNKILAETIASQYEIEAIDVTDEKALFNEPVDLVFIGGATYAHGIDKRLKDYINGLTPEIIQRAVLFSSSGITKRAIKVMRYLFERRGIQVDDNFIFVRGNVTEDKKEEIIEDIKKFEWITKIAKRGYRIRYFFI